MRSVVTLTQPTIDLAPGIWDITLHARGYWSYAQRVEIGPETRNLSIRLWESASVSGSLSVPAGAVPPREVNLVLSSSPAVKEDRALNQVSLVCPVADGSWRCEVPAIPLDIVVRAEDYMPHYAWDQVPRPGGELSLGTIPMQKGASLAGWVKRLDGGSVEGVQVTLALMGGLEKNQAARQSAQAPPSRTNHRGFFQIRGAGAGDSWATATISGLPPSILPVRVAPDGETILHEPLVLAGLSRIIVDVDPPLDPWGAQWNLKLVQVSEQPGAGHFSEEAARGTADKLGRWRADRLSQGRYILTVQRAQDDSWHDELIELPGGKDHSVLVSITVMTIRGRLRLGSSPLEAVLWFGGKSGSERYEFRSDKEGLFDGFLSRPGSWIVDVHSANPNLDRRLEVDVTDSPDPFVEIDLPDTVLRGRVVDTTGNPWPNARVTIHPLAQQKAAGTDTADQEGRFEFRGMPAGPVQLWADGDADNTSGPVVFNVQEASHAADQTVTIRPKMRLSGVVLSAGEPVAGATVLAIPGPDVITSVRPTQTGDDGSFAASVPHNTRSVDLRILARGHVYKRLTVALPARGPVKIELPLQAGRLILEFPDPPNPQNWAAPSLMAYHDGQWDFLRSLENWSRMNGELPTDPHVMIIPRVEPGTWAFCYMTPNTKLPRSPEELAPGYCVSGTLYPGGELRLVVPSPVHAKDGG